MSKPVDKLQTIGEFLGEKRVEDLKDYVLAEVKSDFYESLREQWLLMPSEFENAWNEMLTDIAKSVTKKYKGEIKAIVEQAVEEKLAKLKMEINNEDSD
ncbi:MAG: hypothetical protein J6U54_17800 [Clostridiales bacterium]|nr:hypothetical protein [Clostridiales bacterium]